MLELDGTKATSDEICIIMKMWMEVIAYTERNARDAD
jgi:hypothetical protein